MIGTLWLARESVMKSVHLTANYVRIISVHYVRH